MAWSYIAGLGEVSICFSGFAFLVNKNPVF
jgi:hypothetical protein